MSAMVEDGVVLLAGGVELYDDLPFVRRFRGLDEGADAEGTEWDAARSLGTARSAETVVRAQPAPCRRAWARKMGLAPWGER